MTAIEITPTETSAMPAEFDPAKAEAFGQHMMGILGGGLLACTRADGNAAGPARGCDQRAAHHPGRRRRFRRKAPSRRP